MSLFAHLNKKINKKGNILMFVMVFGSVSFVMIVGGLMSYASIEHRASVKGHQGDMALSIAEKGMEYARWRLAHNAQEFIGSEKFVSPVIFQLQYDSYPAETSWRITDSENNVLYMGQGQSGQSGYIFQTEFVLEPGNYTFSIFDSANDGLCCSGLWGTIPTYYSLVDGEDSVMYEGGGNFGSQESFAFTIVSSKIEPHSTIIYDKFGDALGEYTIYVIPREENSVVEVVSEGRLIHETKPRHTIRAIFAKSSSLEHVIVADKNIYLDANMNITGSVLANGGVRADTTTGSWIRSATSTFTYNNGNNIEDGVYGTGGQESFWQFPVQEFDMGSVVEQLTGLYYAALSTNSLFRAYNYKISPSFSQISGAPQPCSDLDFLQQGGNGQCGMGIWFFANGKYRVYKIFRSQNQNPQASQIEAQPFPNSLFWAGVSGGNPQNFFPRNYDAPFINGGYFHTSYARQVTADRDLPASGVIFFENTHVWVGGVTPGKVTVVAARTTNPYHDSTSPRQFPTEYNDINASIFIAGNVTQSNPGTADNAIGLITQNFIAPTLGSYTNLTVQAALFSQFGSIGLPKHSEFNKSSFTFFGSMIVGGRGTSFKYADGTGYQSVTINYDSSLKYNPPPGFPVSPYYELVSWERLAPGSATSSSSVLLENGEACTESGQCVSGFCGGNGQCQEQCTDTNLVINGDFATNSSYMWWFNSTNASVAFNSGFADFAISSGGGNLWQPELGQRVSLTENQLYTVRFDIKTNQSPRSVVVAAEGGSDSNYVNRGLLETVDVTTAWSAHTLTFVSNATDSTSDITFKLGGNINNIQIDNVKLFAGVPCE